MNPDKKPLGIYVHVPYCISKCPYCAFNSTEAPMPEKKYTDALIKELSTRVKKERLDERTSVVESVYFGGGTPSLLSSGAVRRLMASFAGRFDVRGAEITVEANPGAAPPEKLKGFKAAGVNRISIGIQSLSDAELKRLGRVHTAHEAKKAVAEARRAGFENITLDLIFAIPGQTMRDWKKTLSECARLKPAHVSMYGLTAEEGTPLERDVRAGAVCLPSEDMHVRMYREGARALKKTGLLRYEISNFALPGFESRHNTGYWTGKNYLGLGAGAHSCFAFPGWGRRLWNEKDPARYMAGAAKGRTTAGCEVLDEKTARTEALMLGIRLECGIDCASFKKRFGDDPEKFLDMKRLKKLGLIKRSGGRIRLTEKGIVFSDEVF